MELKTGPGEERECVEHEAGEEALFVILHVKLELVRRHADSKEVAAAWMSKPSLSISVRGRELRDSIKRCQRAQDTQLEVDRLPDVIQEVEWEALPLCHGGLQISPTSQVALCSCEARFDAIAIYSSMC
jgi:hypothetical protein